MESKASTESLRKKLSALLSATLESFAHELLYARHVYTRETFGPSRFLGLQTHVNRHSAVVSYVSETIDVAVPALVAGVADGISLIIFESNDEKSAKPDKILENYNLQVLKLPSDLKEGIDEVRLMHLLERSMRDLIARIRSVYVESFEKTKFSDCVSFKMMLHVTEENKSCTELNEAFANGSWFCSDSSSASGMCNNNQGIRPLHEISASSCVMKLSMSKSKPKEANARDPFPNHGH